MEQPGAAPVDDQDIYLPASLNRIAELIGREKTIMFARAFGGKNVYFPNPNNKKIMNNKICAAIGSDAAHILLKEMMGDCIYIPATVISTRMANRKAMRELYAKGLSLGEIANRLGVDRRTVQRNAVSPKLAEYHLPGQGIARAAKLTPRTRWRAMRALRALGWSIDDIADAFGVTTNTAVKTPSLQHPPSPRLPSRDAPRQRLPEAAAIAPDPRRCRLGSVPRISIKAAWLLTGTGTAPLLPFAPAPGKSSPANATLIRHPPPLHGGISPDEPGLAGNAVSDQRGSGVGKQDTETFCGSSPDAPWSPLDAVRRDLGQTACERLIRAAGGRRIFVPQHPTARLIARFGNDDLAEELAGWLCRHRGGEHITIPLGQIIRHRQNAADALRLTDEGCGAGEIAAALGITERSVYRIRGRAKTRRHLPKGTIR